MLAECSVSPARTFSVARLPIEATVRIPAAHLGIRRSANPFVILGELDPDRRVHRTPILSRGFAAAPAGDVHRTATTARIAVTTVSAQSKTISLWLQPGASTW